jgi:hypothetical protein
MKETAIFFLPYGKAEYSLSPLLPRVRRSLLQPHPWTPRIWGILDFCNVRVNITLERGLWDGLSEFAHEQSLVKCQRFPTIKALRMAVKVFLRLKPKEINAVLRRDTLY